MKYIFLSLLYCLCIATLYAQTGIVKTNQGLPLADATIKVNGQLLTSTDHNGVFSFDCKIGDVISVTHVGFEQQSKTIQDCAAELSFQLEASTVLLEGVEITATTNQSKLMLNQPSSISKLGDVEIKRSLGLFLDDAINANIPGVFMQRRSVSAGQQLNIRGYGGGGPGPRGGDNNFDGMGIKTYLNGIPITDAEGITVLDDIDFASIGNVEILKGPAGALYGLAIAGVVNLQTVKATPNKTSLSQNTLFGSYGLRRSTTTLQTGNQNSSILVNYGSQNFDGFMQHTKSTKDFVNMMGDFKLNEKQSLTTYFGYSNSYDQRNGELSFAQYYARDYSGNPDYIKNNAHSNIISFRAGVGHTYKFNDQVSNFTTVFGTGISNNASSAGGWTDKAPVNYGLRSIFNFKFKLSEQVQLSGIAGIEAQQQQAQIIAYNLVKNLADPNGYNIIGSTRSNQSTTNSTYTVFTQWTLALPHRFSFTTGLSSSTMNIVLRDNVYVPANNTATNTVPTTYATNYKNLLSPTVSLIKLITKDLSLYASYSQGYRAPVSSNIYTPLAGTVNTSLKPELGQQFEIGSKGNLLNGKLDYTLAYFNAVFSNKLTTVAVPNAANTATAYTYTVNRGGLNNNGIEAMVWYQAYQSEKGWLRSVRPFVNYTYSDFKYMNFIYQNNALTPAADFTGKAVAGVPKNAYNAGIDVSTNQGIYFNTVYMHRDPVSITSDGSLMTSAYDLINSKIGFRKTFGKHFDMDVYFGVNNIASKQYYQMVFINQQPDTFLPGPRWANYFGGLNLKYIF